MSIEDNGSRVATKSLQECKPDYKQRARKMKLKVEAATNLKYEFKKIAPYIENV